MPSHCHLFEIAVRANASVLRTFRGRRDRSSCRIRHRSSYLAKSRTASFRTVGQITFSRTNAPSVSAPGTNGTHTVMIR